jgi:hypothetical protein
MKTVFIGFEDFGGILEFLFWEPSIIRGRVAFPRHEVLDSTFLSLMGKDRVDLVFFFSINEIWGRFGIIRSMDFSLFIRGQLRGMERRVNSPGFREFQMERDGGKDLINGKGSMSLRGKFPRGEMSQEVGCREPDLISDLPWCVLLGEGSFSHSLHSQVVACNNFFSDLLEECVTTWLGQDVTKKIVLRLLSVRSNLRI